MLLLVGRLLVAGVFAVSAAGKAADRAGSRRGALELGVPVPFAGAIAVVLPVLEVTLAGLLLVQATASWAALISAVLFGIFSAAIGIALARGKRPDCHCFGALHSSPAGAAALVRNVGLLGVAATVALAGWTDPGANPLGWIGGLGATDAIVIGLTVLVVAQSWVSLHLLRQHGRLMLRMEQLEGGQQTPPSRGLPVGTRAPEFELPGLDGLLVRSPEMLHGSDLLLVFTDPECVACKALYPEVALWQQAVREPAVAVITRGEVERNRALLEPHGVGNVLVQEDREVSSLFEAVATPSAVLLRRDGTIATQVAAGPQEIHELASSVLAPVRDATRMVFAGLGGERVAITDFVGRSTVLLFWNPTCSFCAAMLEQLRSWERLRGNDDPHLLILTSGDRTLSAAQGFASPTALDPGFSVGRLFGAPGTPSAILLNRDGVVSSEVTAGPEAVMLLIRGTPADPATPQADEVQDLRAPVATAGA